MRGVLLDSFSVFRGCLSVERPPLNLMCCCNYCGLSFYCSMFFCYGGGGVIGSNIAFVVLASIDFSKGRACPFDNITRC